MTKLKACMGTSNIKSSLQTTGTNLLAHEKPSETLMPPAHLLMMYYLLAGGGRVFIHPTQRKLLLS